MQLSLEQKKLYYLTIYRVVWYILGYYVMNIAKLYSIEKNYKTSKQNKVILQDNRITSGDFLWDIPQKLKMIC